MKSSSVLISASLKCVLLPASGIALLAAAPAAYAQSTFSFDPTAQFELRGIASDLDFDEGEDVDSSGVGARGEVGVNINHGDATRIRIEAEASAFSYRDDTRGTRESYGGAIELQQELSDQVQFRLRARRIENVALLEANSADQTSAAARLQWQKGNDRVRLEGEYREREYDTTRQGKGDGYRLSAQYNRRLGSYHWLRLDVRVEDMESDDEPRRSYDRRVVRIKYSLPVVERLRVRPWIEYRDWDYDARVAQGDPNGSLRKDHYVAPGIELAYGRSSRGVYGAAGVEYRLRSSNDERYDTNAIRASVRIGYRF